MKAIPIKQVLNATTKLKDIKLHDGGIYEQHKGMGDDSAYYYFTKQGDPNTIYMEVTAELWDAMNK